MQHKDSASFWYIFSLPILLAAITAFIYYPSLHFGFQFDDLPNITKHFNIRHSTLSDLFFSGSRWISYWLNALHYSFGKFDPFSYRMGNVAIHIANGTLLFILLYCLLSRLQKNIFFARHSLSLATLSSALFLLHPAHTQTVSYVIQGQLEGLATLSVLLLGLLYLWYTRTNSSFFRGSLIFILLAGAALACCTKEIAIVTPALLLIFDWFLIAQGDVGKLKSRIWLLSSISLVMGSLYVYFLKPTFIKNILTFNYEVGNNIGNMLTENPGESIKPFYFFISQFKVIVHYLSMYLWPFNMSVEYDWKLSKGFTAPDVIVPFFILTALCFGIFRLLKKNPINPIAFGALWFAICIAPRSSFIPSSELLSDYKAYMASIGWLFIIAAACIKLSELAMHYTPSLILWRPYYRQFTGLIALFLICTPLGLVTKNQNMIWSSGLEFWGAMIKNAPGKARAYNNYGVELGEKLGQWKESIPYYQKAIAMDKNYPDPCNNLAVAYAQTNDIGNAIKAMQMALKINPAFPEGHNNLAAFYLQKQDYENAIKSLHIALKLRPHYGKAHYNLGRALLAQNKPEEAWQAFKDCCTKADMDNETGFSCYAQTSFALKKYDDAIVACKKILEINPRNENALFHLANSYYLISHYEDAAQAYQTMLSYYPNDQRALFNAGETYLRMQKPLLAQTYFEKCRQQPGHAPEVYQRLANCKAMLAQVNC